MPRVTLWPSGAAVVVPAGTTLLTSAQQAGVTEVTCCGMAPPCGRCRVTVLEGEERVAPPAPLEADLLGLRRFLPGDRFGCLARVEGDVDVEVHA